MKRSANSFTAGSCVGAASADAPLASPIDRRIAGGAGDVPADDAAADVAEVTDARDGVGSELTAA